MSAELPSIPSDFVGLTAQVGADPLQVQGAGGNTSWKSGDVMWVKASGTMLANAAHEDIFVAVSVGRSCAQIDGEGDGSCVSAKLDASSLRPSIETTFHALLPWAVVVHTHSVAAIAHASCARGRDALGGKLAGINWAQVMYRRPGLPLTRAISDVLGDPPAQVLLLANHGLIVCANNVEDARLLLDEIERKIALPKAPLSLAEPPQDPPQGWDWLPEMAPLACVSRIAEIACAGSYYPDHVVFLGPALPCAEDVASAREMGRRLKRPAMLVNGTGVLLSRDAPSGAAPMLGCLRDVLVRLPENWELDSLAPQQEAELLDWNAEKYRQQLARTAVPE